MDLSYENTDIHLYFLFSHIFFLYIIIYIFAFILSSRETIITLAFFFFRNAAITSLYCHLELALTVCSRTTLPEYLQISLKFL